jgi:predicted DNA-binding transcriptional regulator AlpA
MSLDFLYERTFSFADLVRLTGLSRANIHTQVNRGRFVPEFPQRVGAGGNREAPAYTGSDVLTLHLIAKLVHYEHADEEFLDEALGVLQSHIRDFMRSKGRWGNEPVRGISKGRNSEKPRYTVVKWTPKGWTINTNSNNPGKQLRLAGGPWCLMLVLDLHPQVDTEIVRMAEYSRRVSLGENRDKALRDVDERLAKYPINTLWLGYLRAMKDVFVDL